MKVTQLDIIKFLISFINFILTTIIYIRNLYKSEVFLNKVKLNSNKLVQYVKLIYNSSKYKEYNEYLKYSDIVKPDLVFTSTDNNSSVTVNEVHDNYGPITPEFKYVLKFVDVKNSIFAGTYVSLNDRVKRVGIVNDKYFWIQDYTTLLLFRILNGSIALINMMELKLHEDRDVSLDDVILDTGTVMDVILKINNITINYENNTYTIIYEDGLEHQYQLPNF